MLTFWLCFHSAWVLIWLLRLSAFLVLGFLVLPLTIDRVTGFAVALIALDHSSRVAGIIRWSDRGMV